MVRTKYELRLETCLVILQLISGCVAVRARSYNPKVYEECIRSKDCTADNSAGCATIYQDRNYGGWKQCVPLTNNGCVTLDDWWQVSGGRVSAINTHGTCIRLYDEKNCGGFSVEMKATSTPISINHADLSDIGWEDAVKSVGSCDREQTYKCTVENLFGTTLYEKSVSDNTEVIFRTIADTGMNLVGGFVPPANVAYTIIQAIDAIRKGNPYPALIDAKVEQAIAHNAAVQIRAKTGILVNWLQTIVSTNTSVSDIKIELLIALHTCQEIFLLFEDSTYVFSSKKVLSSPYLVTFSNIYLALASMLYEFRSDLRTILKEDMAILAKLNEDYLKGARKERISQIVAEEVGYCGSASQAAGLPCGPEVIDKLIFKNYKMCDLMDDSNCGGDLDKHKRCVVDIQRDILIRLDAFFTPTINRLKIFANRNN